LAGEVHIDDELKLNHANDSLLSDIKGLKGALADGDVLQYNAGAVSSISLSTLTSMLPPGDKGDKGDTGDIGPKGDTGDIGPKGDTGDIGPKGDTGDVGPKGDTGDVGPAGDQANLDNAHLTGSFYLNSNSSDCVREERIYKESVLASGTPAEFKTFNPSSELLYVELECYVYGASASGKVRKSALYKEQSGMLSMISGSDESSIVGGVVGTECEAFIDGQYVKVKHVGNSTVGNAKFTTVVKSVRFSL
jgi:hypothetical protein